MQKKKIKRVGVFANNTSESIKKISSNIELDYLQLHGNEKPSFITNIKKITKIKIIKALKINNKNDLKKISTFRKVSDYILLDTKIVNKNSLNLKKKSKKINWDLLKNIKNKKKLILSGALDIKNLKNAVKSSNIKFVDVSSSLENKIGNKDNKKINKFLELALKL
ncbi:MAG: hypothetical protein CMI97_02105 [Pelagibacteraceae bacterium]|nr:hypothetical protein [Pelagibacteraceae bacterium]